MDGRFQLLIWPWPGGGGARPWPSGAGGEKSGADLYRGWTWTRAGPGPGGPGPSATFVAPSATWPWPGAAATSPWERPVTENAQSLGTPSKFQKMPFGVGWGLGGHQLG